MSNTKVKSMPTWASQELIEGETWLPVEGYEGLYEVSDFARVRSLGPRRRGNSKLIKQQTISKGYLFVALSKDGKVKTTSLHRTVAKAFIPNPLNLPQVNHIDGNKLHNLIPNLEWVTHQQNMTHAQVTGLLKPRGEDNILHKLTNEDVRYIIGSNESNVDLGKKFKVSSSAIQGVRTGKSWVHITGIVPSRKKVSNHE